jgi:hypothetical protein
VRFNRVEWVESLKGQAQTDEVNRVRELLMATFEGQFRSTETCLALISIAVQIMDDIDQMQPDDIKSELGRMVSYIVDDTAIKPEVVQ